MKYYDAKKTLFANTAKDSDLQFSYKILTRFYKC